jgi:hypothetical protein
LQRLNLLWQQLSKHQLRLQVQRQEPRQALVLVVHDLETIHLLLPSAHRVLAIIHLLPAALGHVQLAAV